MFSEQSTIANLDFQIIKTKRKTLSIQIDRQGILSIRAPQRINSQTIQNFIEKKQAWILKTIEKQKNSFSSLLKKEKPLEQGKIVLFGNEKELIFTITGSPQINAEFLEFPQKYEYHKAFSGKLKDFYKKQLLAYLFSRIGVFSHHLGLELGTTKINLKVREYKSKWGHCQYKHTKSIFNLNKNSLPKDVNLAFNVKLTQFPVEIVDYVLVHELAHIFQPNHSKDFWSVVEKAYPDYKASRKWLKAQDTSLVLD